MISEKALSKAVLDASFPIHSELKAAEANRPVYYRQVVSYLKLSRMRFGLLINFGSEHLKDGIKRVVNGYPGQTMS